jgi:CDP-diacylglycerol--glycerol-3-phosphate 3-phosphatidyltransferase
VRITANQLTVFRIISLPIPCILLYGGPNAKLAALFLFGILAFTDYLDGVLARRHGTTPFGTFFDPIADKIFITVIYVPFVYLGYIPLWTALLLFLREFLITEVRRLMSQKKLELRVTELAKSKTTIQMAGASFIILVHLISDWNLVITLFSLPVVFTLGLAAISLIWKRSIPHRIVLALCCFSYILLIRLFFNPQMSAFLYMVVIIGFTYVSGFQYIMVSYQAWIETYNNPFFPIFRLLSSFLIPLLALAMLHFVPNLSWLVIFVISFDFASQGLDTWISSLGREEKLKDRLKQAIIIPLALGIGVLLFAFADTQTAARGFVWISLILSTLYMATDYYGHRKLLLTGTFPQP